MAAMEGRVAALEGAMVLAGAAGSSRAREEPTPNQTLGGKDKRKNSTTSQRAQVSAALSLRS
ncbi:hypothetical protein Droror1_Dr00015224, partial [Drosera rotundifolia]